MALYSFTASTDFIGKSGSASLKRYFLSQGTGAQTIRFHTGGSAGPVAFEVQLPATSSKEMDFGTPPMVLPGPLYVEVVGTGFTRGCVDLG